jgi:tetratricopeptide (TPR) repeat protein
MLPNWLNTRDAIAVGTALADSFLPDGASAGSRPARGTGQSGPDIQGLLQRAARDVRPLNLNLLKRAKLLSTFKWRLLDRGFAREVADELTHLVTLQISGAPPVLGAAGSNVSRKLAPKKSSTAIPGLIAEADAEFAAGDLEATVETLQKVLAINPRHAIAQTKLGAAYFNLGRYEEAERSYRRATELKADCAEAHFRLGVLLQWKGQFVPSEVALRRAVKHDPGHAEARVALGVVVALRGDRDEARDCFEKALQLQPRNTSALCALGDLEAVDGRFDEAEKRYRAALEIDPLKPAAWAQLAAQRRMTAADGDWLEGVQRTLASGVSPFEESRLRFALGKYFDDLGQYSRAFEEYERGNAFTRRFVPPYDRAGRAAFVDDMTRVYTAERLARPLEGSCDSSRPVLVTGMMRSGTSLVEQIIASHPEAFGAGELDFWNEASHRHERSLREAPPDPPLARRLADSYLRELARHSPDAARVVDKSTFNASHLGVIHCVFPRARILYTSRDPLDTCLSCYFQDFSNAANFTMDLSDLAHYYREHHRLMEHWRRVLPPGVLLEVPYAELVEEPQKWSRRIIEFIGLPWDARCLEFHRTKRVVGTASQWQVRQPIYSHSVGRWRHYRKHIGPLLELQALSG